MGERRRFDRNCIPKGVGDWEVFVFNRPQGKGFWVGICREPLTQKVRRKKRKQNKSEPTLYSYFEEVWGIRNRHMVKDLPHPYVFMLLPCKAKDRPHPRCEENGNSDDGNTLVPW